MKRTLSIILAAVMLLACTCTAFADDMLLISPAPAKQPFTAASVSGVDFAKAVKTEAAYTYTNWTGAATTVDLYTVTVPNGTSNVKLTFEDEVLCYNYAFTAEGAVSVTDANYLSGAVADTDVKEGFCAYTVPLDSMLVNYDGTTAPADGVIDYVQIQTPYDADWNTTVLYAITFALEDTTAENIGAVFTDIEAGSELAKVAAWALNNGVTAGMGAGKFGPESIITREQMVTFLWNLAGQPADRAEENFSDVAADKWYAAPISWAKATGVSVGAGNNTFRVGKTLSRQEVIWFLSNNSGKTVEEIGALVPEDGTNRGDVLTAIYNVFSH